MKEVENNYAERDAAARAAYGRGVYRISVDGYEEGEQLAAYAKFPDLATISQIRSLLEKDEIGAMDQLFNKCVIKDLTDPEVLSNAEFRFAVMQELPSLLAKKKAQLHKI